MNPLAEILKVNASTASQDKVLTKMAIENQGL